MEHKRIEIDCKIQTNVLNLITLTFWDGSPLPLLYIYAFSCVKYTRGT